MTVRVSHILRHQRHNGSIGTPVSYCGREAGNGAKPAPGIEAVYEFLEKVSKGHMGMDESPFCQACLVDVMETLRIGLRGKVHKTAPKIRKKAGKGYFVGFQQIERGLN